jgi:DNA-directed RNA polymerase subunit RPC12/RpoP
MPEKYDPEMICPNCKSGPMPMLKRIEYDDKSATVYLRCPSCSHLEIVQEERAESKPN